MNRRGQSRINPGGLDFTHNRMNIKGYASRAVGRRLKEASPHLLFLPTARPLTFILLYEGWPLTGLMQRPLLSRIRNLQLIGANAMIVM